MSKRSTEDIIQVLEKEVKAAKPWPMIVSQTKELKRVLKYTRKLEKKLAKLQKED
jgi:hypothetical protein